MSTGEDPAGTPNTPAVDKAALREQMRQQFITGLGGWTGMALAAVPTVVFVVVNAVTELRVAAISAVASSLVLAGVRMALKQSPQQALSGLLGVVIAVAIAARTGEARGYFLFGIITSFVYGLACLSTILVRRPAAGLLWEFLDPTPPARTPDPAPPARAPDPAQPARAPDPTQPARTSDPTPQSQASPLPWYRRRALLTAYSWATGAAVLVFLARGVVQLALYHRDDTGLLAVARIAMGYPLTIVAILFAVWIVRRTRHRENPA